MKHIVKIFVPLILFSVLLTCKKDSSQSDVPNTLVDITIYLTEPQYTALNTVTNWAYVSGGVRGIFVYHSAPDAFVAIERNCTYQANNSSAIVSVDSSNTAHLKDASCGSKFYISDGSVAGAPATVPLKRYQTSYNSSTFVLHIFN